MIKIIFFDLDGVLTKNKVGSTVQSAFFAEKYNLSQQELLEKRRPYTVKDNTGLMTNFEAYQEILKDFGIDNLTIDIMEESFAATPVDNRMIEFAKKLKTDYKVGIITDNTKDRVDYLIAMYNWAAIFDPIINSAEVGTMKNATKIFDIAVKQARCKHNECIFIDNSQKNIDVCNKTGIHGIFFDDEVRDYEKLLNEIETKLSS